MKTFLPHISGTDYYSSHPTENKSVYIGKAMHDRKFMICQNSDFYHDINSFEEFILKNGVTNNFGRALNSEWFLEHMIKAKGYEFVLYTNDRNGNE